MKKQEGLLRQVARWLRGVVEESDAHQLAQQLIDYFELQDVAEARKRFDDPRRSNSREPLLAKARELAAAAKQTSREAGTTP